MKKQLLFISILFFGFAKSQEIQFQNSAEGSSKIKYKHETYDFYCEEKDDCEEKIKSFLDLISKDGWEFLKKYEVDNSQFIRKFVLHLRLKIEPEKE